MNPSNYIPPYVKAADDRYVVVRPFDTSDHSYLVANGFHDEGNGDFSKRVEHVQEKVILMADLRDHGFAFSTGSGWSPSEVFEELRDKGLLEGSYERISWSGPGCFHVTRA